MISRRETVGALALFGGAAAAWPLSLRAQQPAMPVIGLLGSASPGPWANRLRAFREGLGEAGYAEGRNVAFEYRWAETRFDRLPTLAAELVRQRVAVIVVLGGLAATVAAKAATTAIPIVFRTAGDPVEDGIVTSLSRPGGNLTGVTTMGTGLGPKHLQLLHELVPAANVFALLVNPANHLVAEIESRNMHAAIPALGLQLHILHASSDPDLDVAFANLSQLRAGGLVISSDVFFGTRNEQMAALAARHAVPAISPYREFTEAGGLMSYGGGIIDACRLAGVYTGRILKGEKPGDLPVQQATKVEFVFNLGTAKTLGLDVPQSLLARADEVIE